MPSSAPPRPAFHLVDWKDPAVVAVAFVSLASGFGSYGTVAALGDVAKTFGHITHGASLADQAGLSGTVLGVGLAVIRLASIGGLFLAGAADRFGRRRMLIGTCAAGLALTIAAALSPSYWWFVGIFAVGRPLLSATNGIAQVSAAELTPSSDRAKGLALIAAGYGVGAGLTAMIHSLGEGTLGFRGVFALAIVPLLLLPLFARHVVEPERYTAVTASEHRPPVLGPVGPAFRRRLVLIAFLAFAVSVITGPADSFVYFYAENIKHLSGIVTSGMVVAAGLAGLGGLVAGRWLADHLGRRSTSAMAIVGMAAFGILAYSGSKPALFAGYVFGVLAGSVFAPAGGALANELFPTSVRASVAGWYIAAGVLGAVVGLLVFGAVAEAANRFSIAALATFLPAVPALGLLWLFPETKGHEPEELWGEHPDSRSAVELRGVSGRRSASRATSSPRGRRSAATDG